jgi:hypothetical protein
MGRTGTRETPIKAIGLPKYSQKPFSGAYRLFEIPAFF